MPASYTRPRLCTLPVLIRLAASSTFFEVIRFEAPAWSPMPHRDGYHFSVIGQPSGGAAACAAPPDNASPPVSAPRAAISRNRRRPWSGSPAFTPSGAGWAFCIGTPPEFGPAQDLREVRMDRPAEFRDKSAAGRHPTLDINGPAASAAPLLLPDACRGLGLVYLVT